MLTNAFYVLRRAHLHLIALASATILIIYPLQPSWAALDEPEQSYDLSDIELPSALADDDSFDDLPFEQLRQALREEVERDPTRNRNIPSYSSKRYNLLIR